MDRSCTIVGREVETTVTSIGEMRPVTERPKMMAQKRKPRSVSSAAIVSAGFLLHPEVVLIMILAAFSSVGVPAWHFFPVFLRSSSFAASICAIRITSTIAIEYRVRFASFAISCWLFHENRC